MIKAAVLGASGYTGLELLRILAIHPEVEVVKATSRQYEGQAVVGVFPSLTGFYDGLLFSDPAEFLQTGAQVVFSCLPHGASQEVVPGLVEAGHKVVDLSADFRIKDVKTFNEWYGEHKAPGLVKKAVYGLPELYRDDIKAASLVANPGCYPTGAVLALAPLMKGGLVDTARPVLIDSKSGVSGAGRGASLSTSYVEVAGGFKAYKVGSHRHTPEIAQELGLLAGKNVSITFTPHLLPVQRGILTTAYVWLKGSPGPEGLQGLYYTFYAREPFVRVMPEGAFPDISQVRSSNYCDIGVWYDPKEKKAVIISAIDNLVKGASGQAVQNMNLMCGFEETTALQSPPTSI
jgi:N-acetyl-gamma-glutamyl-phosphate reductase